MATASDGELILKLYELRTEAVMRQARAWVMGQFWPKTAEDFFAVAGNPADEHNPWLRQVVSYWEMAAALVLHGALPADLFADCNGEGFVLLAKFEPLLEEIRKKQPGFLENTVQLVSRSSPAAARYKATREHIAARMK